MNDLLVYDVEVFKFDWFITIRCLSNDEYIKIHNDLESLKAFYELHKYCIWVGHNIVHYDNIIIRALLKGIEGEKLKKISDSIIIEDKGNVICKNLKLKEITLYSLDIMQDAIRYSLKEIEGYFGMSIEESKISFDIDRKLTDEEINEVFKYNQHDVDATFEELRIRFNRLMNKLRLLKEYNFSLSMLESTNAKLCAEILQAEYKNFTDGLEPYNLAIAPIEIKKYKQCCDFFTNCEKLDYTKSLELYIANIPHVLSNGGLHGAIENFYYEGEIWLVDVSSYYPNIMINFNLCSRAMSNPENFSKLVNTRMQAKKNKELYAHSNEELSKKFSEQSDALKLPINTVSGCMKAKFNKLYDERNNNWMCITGQLLLIDLIESLEENCVLVQSNTDGIIIIPINKNICDEKIKNWEKKTNLFLEKTIAKKIYQKDVNNYILLLENNNVKTKGGYVAQYHNENRYKDMLRRNCEILDDAIVDYLLFNVPLEKTIINKDAPLLKYQIIKKLGSMYDDIVLYKYDDDNNLILERIDNKVNRIFAVNDPHYGKLMKKKKNKDKYDSVENCPEKCDVVNYDIRNMTSNSINLDYDWYINVAKNRIIDFILSNEEKKENKTLSLDALWEKVEKKLQGVYYE